MRRIKGVWEVSSKEMMVPPWRRVDAALASGIPRLARVKERGRHLIFSNTFPLFFFFFDGNETRIRRGSIL